MRENWGGSNVRRVPVQKVQAVVARSSFRSQECKKLRGTEHFWTILDVHMSFRVARARYSASCQKRAKRGASFNSILKKTTAGVRLLNGRRNNVRRSGH